MTTRPRFVALAAGTLSLLMVATAVGPVAAGDAKYRFVGYGTDHGVGLSQRGAVGRAQAGQTYDTILQHYFTTRTGLDVVAPDTVIRALVVKRYRAGDTQTRLVTGRTVSKGVDGSRMRWIVDTPDVAVQGKSFPQGWSLVLKGRGTKGAWHLQVQDSAGAVKLEFTDADAKLEVRQAPTDPDGPLGALKVLIRPTAAYDTYLGAIRIGRKEGRIRVVNVVPIESFVRSVTPQEMGPANPPEALKAQAVVIRSYFLAGGNPSGSLLAADVESYRASQSYKGIQGEDPIVTTAVDATAYQVLVYQGSDGDAAIARTFYHAVGGGATEASQNVFTGAKGEPGAKTPYLRGGPDVDEEGVPYDENASAFSWSTRAMTLRKLSAILRKDPRTNVGMLTSWPVGNERRFRDMRAAALLAGDDATPDPANRGISGRLTWVVLKGTRHGKPVTKRVAGWLFKSVFNANRGSGDPIGSTMIFRRRVP